MKKCFLIVSLVLCFMASAQAAKILVWNFNPDGHDTITDPEVGFRIDCGYWLKTCLTNNSYTITYHDNLNLPADISSYDVIVATLGYPTC